ncbi:MAG: LysR family transcriptional regulator [Deltaproteobacteria bacterium]
MMDLLARKGISLDRLRAFLQVFDAGGIARAAPLQAVRQSQLSRQLKELETALGQPLFVRAGRRLLPTEAGRRLARVIRDLRSGLSDAAAAEGSQRLRLAAGDSVLHWLVLPGLGQLRAECPGLELSVRAEVAPELVQGLEEHEIDLGLMRLGSPTGALKTLRLGKVGFAVFAARRHRDLERMPLAVPISERALWPLLGQSGAATIECETFPQVAAAVRSGEVAGILPSYANRELPEPQYRRTHLPELAAAATTLLLVWRDRLDELRPQLEPVRRAIARLVREGIA